MYSLPAFLSTSALFVTAALLSACAATTGPDISDAREDGRPILITNMDTYRSNTKTVKISDIVEQETEQLDLAEKTSADVSDPLSDISKPAEADTEENDVVGFYVRFINLLDQDIQSMQFIVRAYDKDLEVITLEETDGKAEDEKNDADPTKVAAETTVKAKDVTEAATETKNDEDKNKAVIAGEMLSTVNTEDNVLVISSSELIKPEVFNRLNYGNFKSVSPNTNISCVRLLSVKITVADGTETEYEGKSLLSSSQYPRCQPSPIE